MFVEPLLSIPVRAGVPAHAGLHPLVFLLTGNALQHTPLQFICCIEICIWLFLAVCQNNHIYMMYDITLDIRRYL